MNKNNVDSFVDNVDNPAKKEDSKNVERHLNHPFYSQARKLWEEVQQMQILKGAEKYPEPFNPDSWSGEQLVIHAMQENIDQAHYICGLFDRVKKLEKQLAEMDAVNESLAVAYDLAKKECEELKRTSAPVQMSMLDESKYGTTYSVYEDFIIKHSILDAVRNGRTVWDGCADAAAKMNNGRTQKACSLRWGLIKRDGEFEMAKKFHVITTAFK